MSVVRRDADVDCRAESMEGSGRQGYERKKVKDIQSATWSFDYASSQAGMSRSRSRSWSWSW